MKKLLPGLLLTFTFLHFPSAVSAQVNVFDYFTCPGCPAVPMNNGELFQYLDEGGGCFKYQKSADPAYYERFCFDSGTIYHHEDTTWANAGGNISCYSGTPACLNFLNYQCGAQGSVCSACNLSQTGMGWIDRVMSVGDCLSAPGTVIGQEKNGGSCGDCCDNQYTGPVTHRMCLSYQGCFVLPTESVCDDGIILSITGGPGTGERFYYCRGYGWVGFQGETGEAFATTDLGGVQSDDCLVVESQGTYPHEPPPPLPPLYDDDETECGPSGTGCSSRADWEVRTCWPDDCDCTPVCNETGYIHHACAQSFNVYDEIEYARNKCVEDEKCNYWIKEKWGGEVVIDPTTVKVPFAGKKKEGVDNPVHEDEIKYLADYFEGTHEYYRDYPLLNAAIPIPWGGNINIRLHGLNSSFINDYEGVLRKLAPYEYQNQLKKGMVLRAQISNAEGMETGKIHDYTVRYLERLCWNSPLWLEALVGVAGRLGYDKLDVWKVLDFCLYNSSETFEEHIEMELIQAAVERIPGIKIQEKEKTEADLSELIAPPSPDEENYAENWNAWQESSNEKWWRLWQVAPMVTREDTRGYIDAVPELRSGGGEQVDGSREQVADDLSNAVRFPHLARLFESSHWVQQILLPEGIMRTSDQNPWASQVSESNLAETVSTGNTLTASALTGSGCGTNRQTTLLAASGGTASVLGNKIMLAQTDEAPEQNGVPFVCASITANANVAPTSEGANVSVTVTYLKTCTESGGMHIQPLVNGAEVLGGWAVIDNLLPFNLEPPWSRSPFTVARGQCKTYRYGYRSWECPCVDGYNEESIVCEYCVDRAGAFSTNCKATGDGQLPPAPVPACRVPKVPESSQCVYEAITDPNPNDNICADQLRFTFTAVDEYHNKYCIAGNGEPGCQCKNVSDADCGKPHLLKTECERFCCRTEKVPVFRQVEVKTQIPYLTQIWDHANNSFQGFYNLFRPASEPEFEDTAAKSEINYYYRSRTSGSTEVSVPVGDFYYPLLGGVQLGKERVLRTLTPYVE